MSALANSTWTHTHIYDTTATGKKNCDTLQSVGWFCVLLYVFLYVSFQLLLSRNKKKKQIEYSKNEKQRNWTQNLCLNRSLLPLVCMLTHRIWFLNRKIQIYNLFSFGVVDVVVSLFSLFRIVYIIVFQWSAKKYTRFFLSVSRNMNAFYTASKNKWNGMKTINVR